ncbi:Metalloproteases (zincins), catalytic [Glarea lozoyensis ATCC 20868]|uniref:Metalloproteases (Zincins), catalytic n=1 Tax=Glarea lozoyensis (strain ATCC 20868 / MF5171) TaxID=1116229 RepID=S3CZI3_GLAL2|nr:Metalloproteases (zincins), catalytic [Glarea lozoyensis ATCC 20868]EPE31040.1 Metalloproteases (zincins), catalytic [Glarea lozoyensis ATCC 20868]
MYITALLVLFICLGFSVTHPSSHKTTIEQRQVPDAEPSPAPVVFMDEPDIQNLNYIDPSSGLPFPPLKYVFPSTYLDPECTGAEELILKHAWRVARDIVAAQTTTFRDYNYDFPHSCWLGDDWNSAGDHSKYIADSFKLIQRLFGGLMKDKNIIVWRCSESSNPSLICRTGIDGTQLETTATTKYHVGRQGRGYWVQTTLFCPRFFQYETLKQQVERYKDEKEGQLRIANFEYRTAKTMLHETWHYGVVSDAIDYVYGSQACYKLARSNGAQITSLNADSLAYDGLAIYLHRKFKSIHPPTTEEHLEALRAQNPLSV